jgi:hypothetical protein
MRHAEVLWLDAKIRVHVGDARLARTMTSAIAEAVRAAGNAAPLEELPIVRLRTRKRLDMLTREAPERIAGAIAIVRLTEKNARRLPDLVDAVRAAGPAGVQIVWDGNTPPASRVERHVFTLLERARATPSGPPVVLAKTAEPASALRFLVANRPRKDGTRS